MLVRVLSLIPIVVCLAAAGNADEIRFERDIRPLLSDRCFSCHGNDSQQRRAGLRLDTYSGATAARSESRAAIIPGNPTESELIRRITSPDPALRMPPVEMGKSLGREEIRKLTSWIQEGARYEIHWAFQPPQAERPPRVENRDWPRGAIDHFVLARLEKEGLTPAPTADPKALLRRLSFDLIGLPPTRDELASFQHDWVRHPEAAWSAAIDRLLSSPRLGEKWARWWLDLAHYADTDGYTIDYDRPHAWRWRDWVIDAFNQNQPFDQFTLEQIAGDLIPGATTGQLIATGFFRQTLSNREGGANLEEFRVQKIVDRTATYGATWLGLTLECAQCHDHKFDPITQREYYELYAFFNNADEININAPLPGEQDRFDRAIVVYRRQWAELVAPVQPDLNALMRKWEQMMRSAEREPGVDYKRDRALELLGILWGAGQGEGQLEGIRITRIPGAQRTQRQEERLLTYFLARGELGLEREFDKLNLLELKKQIDALDKTLPPISRPQTLQAAMFPRQTHIGRRGDFRSPGEPVTPGTPQFLHPLSSSGLPVTRLDLAQWTISEQNPLVARVLVNRIWQELFGRGLVATPEDFGSQGGPPTHPKLLDWLAVEFVRSGWNLKHLLRTLVNSATYRQSSNMTAEHVQRDPDNILLSRSTRQRMPAELIRDAALAASGILDSRLGGPSVRPPQPTGVTEEGSYNAKWQTSTGSDRYRRGIYTWIQRVTPYAQFATFDLPNPNRSCSRRDQSNTPLQALTLLNDPVFVEVSRALAGRIIRETHEWDHSEKLRYVYQVCLARDPTQTELAHLSKFVNQRTAIHASRGGSLSQQKPLQRIEPAEFLAWVDLAAVMLNLDEFITIE